MCSCSCTHRYPPCTCDFCPCPEMIWQIHKRMHYFDVCSLNFLANPSFLVHISNFFPTNLVIFLTKNLRNFGKPCFSCVNLNKFWQKIHHIFNIMNWRINHGPHLSDLRTHQKGVTCLHFHVSKFTEGRWCNLRVGSIYWKPTSWNAKQKTGRKFSRHPK